MRRRNFRIALTTQLSVSEIIGEEDDDIGLIGSNFGQGECGERDPKGCGQEWFLSCHCLLVWFELQYFRVISKLSPEFCRFLGLNGFFCAFAPLEKPSNARVMTVNGWGA